MINADKYKGLEIGDLITLSDLQTQAEFDKPSVDFEIKEVREYFAQTFSSTAYIVESPNNQDFMLLIRDVGTSFDLTLYYKDQDGDAEEMSGLIAESGEDLVDAFDAECDGKKAHFTKVNDTYFGVECEDGIKTLADYSTGDEFDGNPFAFIEWTGDNKKGFLELWYGCELEKHEVELNSINEEDL